MWDGASPKVGDGSAGGPLKALSAAARKALASILSGSRAMTFWARSLTASQLDSEIASSASSKRLSIRRCMRSLAIMGAYYVCSCNVSTGLRPKVANVLRIPIRGSNSMLWFGSAWGIRTPDLRLERAVSWATRRTRHALGPKMSHQQEGGSTSCYQTYLGFVNRRERPLQSHLTREFLFAINPNWYHLAAIPNGYFRSSKKVFRASTSVYLRLPVSPMVMISDMLFTT